MGRKRLFFSAFTIGIATLFLFSFKEATGSSPVQPECPSWESFGIERYSKTKEAPAFSLENLGGKLVSLSDFKGKPVLITFWATWCPSCKEDIPLLEKLSAKSGNQLVFLLITIDGDKKREAQRFVDEKKISLPVLLLLKDKVMKQYEVRGWIPLSFLIDPEGKLVGKVVGQRDWNSAESWSCLKELFNLR